MTTHQFNRTVYRAVRHDGFGVEHHRQGISNAVMLIILLAVVIAASVLTTIGVH